MEIIGGLLALALLGGLAVWAAVRSHRREAAELKATEGVQQRAAATLAFAATDSTPPVSDERRTQSARDQRDAWLRERETQGLCRHCDDRATHQYPAFKQVSPVLAWVLRYLNATPNTRWMVQLDRGTDVAPVLCESHHEWLVGFFDEQLSKERAAAVRFVADQRTLMYEFARYGSDERAQEEMQQIRRGKKRPPPAKTEGNVVRMPSKRIESAG